MLSEECVPTYVCMQLVLAIIIIMCMMILLRRISHHFISYKDIQSKVIVCFQAKGHPLVVSFVYISSSSYMTSCSNHEYERFYIQLVKQCNQNSLE